MPIMPTAMQPRIWRPAGLDFTGDELRQAEELCTPETLAAIAADGFTSIWLRGRLRRLMASAVFPELDDPDRAETIAAAGRLIGRLRRAGLGLHLFFNEPLALAEDEPFWAGHPDLAGTPHRDFDGERMAGPVRSLCLSHADGARFLDDAASSVLRDLPGLEGVILITASEHHSHCWSHHARRGLDDGIATPAPGPLPCPRCARREPAELVAQIAGAWRRAADIHAPACRIIAWNWSWSFWYPDPQREVVEALPPGVDVLADWERGGSRPWRGRTIAVDEYSLGFAGPSPRFLGTCAAARAGGRRVLAKLQLGTTHEAGSSPSLPLLEQVHAKLAGLHRHGIDGFMGTWNFGCSPSLNTAAVGRFLADPAADADAFLADLARKHLGLADPFDAVAAWRAFGEAMQQYPFHLRMLYFAPVNDAPAHPLSLRYRAQPLGPSWLRHELGDRLEDCLGPFTIEEAADAFAELADGWERGLASYRRALAAPAGASADQRRHADDELRCAEMLGLQWRSTAHLFRFHARRLRLMRDLGLTAPCDLPPVEELTSLMRAEIANAERGLPLLRADSRLGFHQEAMARMYGPETVEAKVAAMRAELNRR